MIQDYTQAWKFIKQETNKIQDDVLKNVIMADYRRRASDEWGFNPDTGIPSRENPDIDDWEQSFVDSIADSVTYGIDTRKEEREKTRKEFIQNMYNFAKNGGRLQDIPENLRSDYVVKTYFEMLRSANFL